jgi:hypothetical protein
MFRGAPAKEKRERGVNRKEAETEVKSSFNRPRH